MSLGLGSSVLSLQAHCLIIDDLVTNSVDLNSDTFRDKLKTTYEQDLLSRLTKKVYKTRPWGNPWWSLLSVLRDPTVITPT